MSQQFIQSQRVYIDDKLQPATIHWDNLGKITRIDRICDVDNDTIIMPGVVDCHVHLNEPGRTDWEGFETGTKAAAAGGVTCVIDMPLNSIPPTTTIANLQDKFDAARGKLNCDVALYGGIIPGNSLELVPLIKAGVKGFKCFLIESGVEEFPAVDEEDLRRALTELAGQDTFVMFHAELGQCSVPVGQYQDYKTFLNSRPDKLEVDAIKLVVKLCREFDFPCHIVHLSSAQALPIILEAKKEGLKLTVETCYHYLHLQEEDIVSGATQYKCCPPIRNKQNKELLWLALLDGTIDYVVSDHSPCTANLKLQSTGDFINAWGGIASVQFGLSIMWQECMDRGVPLKFLVKWLCQNTSKQVGLSDVKGKLEVGYHADFVVILESVTEIQVQNIHFKNKVSPYIGRKFPIKVLQTFVRGNKVYGDGKFEAVGRMM